MSKYKAFTLVEMLIVMGIITILVTVGVVAGRYSYQRANRIFHQNVVDNLSSALIAFKNENGYVPPVQEDVAFFSMGLGYYGDDPFLRAYYEQVPFDGGNDATYYYSSDSQDQFFLVCVSLGGVGETASIGYYCTGTGIGFLPEGDGVQKIDRQNIGTFPDDELVRSINEMNQSTWRKDTGFDFTSDVR